MQVIWKWLYGHHSHMDGGTLLQLRNLLNRSSVPKDPKSNVNATEDFIEVTLIGHVIAAAMEVLGMKGMKDQPAEFPNPDTWLSAERKMQELSKVTRAIVDRFVNLSVLSTDQSDTSEPTVGEPCTERRKEEKGIKEEKKRRPHTPAHVNQMEFMSTQRSILPLDCFTQNSKMQLKKEMVIGL